MITRIVKMTFREDAVPDFLANFEKNKAKIKGFEGCEKLKLLQDLKQANVFFTYSWWQSEENLEMYRQSELFKEVWRFTKSLFSARPEAWSVIEKASL